SKSNQPSRLTCYRPSPAASPTDPHAAEPQTPARIQPTTQIARSHGAAESSPFLSVNPPEPVSLRLPNPPPHGWSALKQRRCRAVPCPGTSCPRATPRSAPRTTPSPTAGTLPGSGRSEPPACGASAPD